MNAERLGAAAGHLLGQHAGGDRVPGRVAHAGHRQQQGEAPESGREGSRQIADRHPPEGQRQQASAVGHPVGQQPGGHVGERRADAVDGEQQADLGRSNDRADI